MSDTTVTGIHIEQGRLHEVKLRGSPRWMQIIRMDTHDFSLSGQAPATTSPGGGANGQAHESRIAAIPSAEVMTRCWSLPDTEERRFRQMVGHRLEADLPIALADLQWDFRSVADGSGPRTGRRVFAQAARRGRIDEYLTALADQGHAVDTLTSEAEALSSFYRRAIKPGADRDRRGELFILADEQGWRVALFVDGLICFMRRLAVREASLAAAALQIRQCVEAELPWDDVDRCCWCGPKELDEQRQRLTELWTLPIVQAEAADTLVDVAGRPLEREQLCRYATAIGTALAGFDEQKSGIRFLQRAQAETPPWRLRLEKNLAHPWRWTAAGVGAALLALAVHVAALAGENRQMQNYLDATAAVRQKMADLTPQVQNVRRLEQYRIDVEGIAADLAAMLPDNILLTSLEFDRNHRLVIKGKAGGSEAAYKLVYAMAESDGFRQARADHVDPGGEFTISAERVGVMPLPASSGFRRAAR